MSRRSEPPPTAPSAPPTKGAQTRRAILDAAISRFGRDGYRATSVADIARDAAVGGTVAYAYFPNKESLFLAAMDEDAAALMAEGAAAAKVVPDTREWPKAMLFAVLGVLDGHPLARRVLAGLEPEVTTRVLEIPSLAELRKVCAERLRAEQLAGTARADIDATVIANGTVAIMLSLLMSLAQLGPEAAAPYGDDVAAVFEAAIGPLSSR